jgi:hypothetical protein
MDQEFKEMNTRITNLVRGFTDTLYYETLLRLKINNQVDKEPFRFYYTVLFKSACTLYGCLPGIENYHNYPQLTTPFYILLRPIILDCLIAEYIDIKSQIDKVDIQELIQRCYYDHIKYAENALKSSLPKINNWDEPFKQKVLKEFKAKHNTFFNSKGALIKNFTTLPKFIEMLNEILNAEKTGVSGIPEHRFLVFKRLFMHYDVYSKYEHLGDLTLWFVQSTFPEKDNITSFHKAFESLWLILTSLIHFVFKWGNEYDNEIIKLMGYQKSLLKEFEDYKIKYRHLQDPLPEL